MNTSDFENCAALYTTNTIEKIACSQKLKKNRQRDGYKKTLVFEPRNNRVNIVKR